MKKIERKLTTKPWFQVNKGFTLIELVLALAISTIVVISLFSLLDFSTKSCIKGDALDQLLLNGRYALEYIKDDIKSADKIIASDKIRGLNLKYPSNIGFVILLMHEDRSGKEYRYITYYLKSGKIVRVACSRTDDKYPTYAYFSGNNNLCEYAETISNTKFQPEEKMIYLDFSFKHSNGEELRLKSDIYIRCPLDYDIVEEP